MLVERRRVKGVAGLVMVRTRLAPLVHVDLNRASCDDSGVVRERLGPPLSWAAVCWLSAVVLVVAVLEVVLAANFGSQPPAIYVSDVLFAVVWSVSGLIAWRARSVSRVGPLMIVMGGLFLLNNPWGFRLPTDFPLRGWITVVGLLGFKLILAVGMHLFLSYPSGRLEHRLDRVLVWLGYASAVVFSVAQLLVLNPNTALCGQRCSVSPIRVGGSTELSMALRTASEVWFGAMAVGLVVFMIVRTVRAGPRYRRQHMPTLVLAVVVAALTAGYLAASTAASDTGWWLLYPGSYLALIAVPVAFLVWLLRQRLAYAAVADLVRGLDQVQADELQPALARALGDPELLVMFPIGDTSDYVDLTGRWVTVPSDGSRAVTELGDQKAPIAALLHDPSLREHPELLHAVGAVARLALENARLHAEVRARLAEVRASRARILAAADDERRRIERDLHDGAQQRLLGIGMSLQLLRARAPEQDIAFLDEAEHELRTAIRELRHLAQGIHPAVLTDEGLLAAIGMLSRRSPVPITVEADLDRRPPATLEVTAYYVISESLQNVVKHARASAVTVRTYTDDGHLVVTVSDDGTGGAQIDSGTGLRGLRDRLATVDGSLEIRSPAGDGTMITARMPCD